jgi:hypothetical protein
MDYRKFITKKMPKILRAIGISSSSESEDEWNNSNLIKMLTQYKLVCWINMTAQKLIFISIWISSSL